VCLTCFFFFFQAEDGIRDVAVTGVQTCALPISHAIVADIAARFPRCRTYHFSNGVNTRAFHPERRTAAARGSLVANGANACVALYAGLHGLAQGLDQVLDAADALRAHPTLRLVLLGDGPAKDKLVEQARQRRLGNVRFLEPRPRDQVPPLVAAAGVAVVPPPPPPPGG